MKLLLVEQSVLLRERLLTMLAGIECLDGIETAATVAEARALMRIARPGIVIMDASLPDGVGTKVLERIRDEGPAACMIVLSHDVSPSYRKCWLQAGADHFFDITAHIDSLLAVVRQAAAVTPGRSGELPA